jgi:hypothetical protein
MTKFKVTDRRVIEACKGLNVDVETAAPAERFDAYCRWTLPSIGSDYSGWSTILLTVAANCGIRISNAY